MSLSAQTLEFFSKVAKKNFGLACDVYYVLASGQEITPKERSMIQEALRIAG